MDNATRYREDAVYSKKQNDRSKARYRKIMSDPVKAAEFIAKRKEAYRIKHGKPAGIVYSMEASESSKWTVEHTMNVLSEFLKL